MGVACMHEKAELVLSRLLERSSRMRKDPSSIACMQLYSDTFCHATKYSMPILTYVSQNEHIQQYKLLIIDVAKG